MNYFQKIENKAEWQDLFDKTLFSTFFHQTEWEEFLEKNFNWLKFERYLYKNDALLSLARCRIFGKEKLISHPFCEYGGPLPLKQDIDGLNFKKDIFENFKEQFKIRIHPVIPRYFKSFGLKEPDSSLDTYFIENINSKNNEEIFSSFRKTLKHSIKKSQKEDIILEMCRKEKELRDFYKIYLGAMKKNRTVPFPFSFLKYFFRCKNVRIILAKIKGKIIAGSLFIFYGKYVHYFLNASNPKYAEKNPNHLILWSQIKNSAGKNYDIFDLGGTGRDSNLEIFKRGWAAKKYPVFELKNFQEINKLQKTKLKKAFDFLPSILTEKFGSDLLKFKL